MSEVDRLEILQAAQNGAGSKPHDARGSGAASARTAHGPGRSSGRTLPQAWVPGRSNKKNGSAAAPFEFFHEFGWGAWPAQPQPAALRPPYTWSRPCPRQGHWFAQAASHLAGWQNEPTS